MLLDIGKKNDCVTGHRSSFEKQQNILNSGISATYFKCWSFLSHHQVLLELEGVFRSASPDLYQAWRTMYHSVEMSDHFIVLVCFWQVELALQSCKIQNVSPLIQSGCSVGWTDQTFWNIFKIAKQVQLSKLTFFLNSKETKKPKKCRIPKFRKKKINSIRSAVLVTVLTYYKLYFYF